MWTKLTFGTIVFLLFLLAGGATTGIAGMNVNLNIGVPAVVVQEPPEMILVPNSLVYFAPGIEAELVFYRGGWYTRSAGRWYRGRSYEGPWAVVAPRSVPAEIARLPRNYRVVHARRDHIPYGQLKKHWRYREEERGHHRSHDRENNHKHKRHGH
jgi:hypothetical protein